MRRAARVDANQAAIVAALRAVGASVMPLHSVGGGCPDLAVGYRGVTYLMECKDGSKPPSARKLTPVQDEWHKEWRGHACIVDGVEDALAVLQIELHE